MIKALMFGGAFNPPTIAHIQLAEYAKKMTLSEGIATSPEIRPVYEAVVNALNEEGAKD